MVEPEKKESEVDYADPEAEVQGNWEKKVDLPEVATVTGEEEEDCIFKMRCKLYRFRQEEWKERGTGNCKLLRHKENKKIRFLLR